MKVLKAIGNFFVRIWRWIKETAWIQPLLIVGVIFGIIFSIPSITEWIQGLAEDANSASTFYSQFQQSLEYGADSDADTLTNYIDNRMNGKDEYRNSKYYVENDKFFLAYVAETCPSCEEAKAGFDTLKNNFSGSLAPKDTNLGFKMYTVFTDQTTDDSSAQKTPFLQYLDRQSYFFEESAEVGRDSYYYINGHLSDSDLGNLEQADPDNFLTPTILLVEFVDENNIGVSEVMFGVDGDNDYEKASLLLHCWDHTVEFSQTGKI